MNVKTLIPSMIASLLLPVFLVATEVQLTNSDDVTLYKDAEKSQLYMTSHSDIKGSPDAPFLVVGVFGC